MAGFTDTWSKVYNFLKIRFWLEQKTPPCTHVCFHHVHLCYFQGEIVRPFFIEWKLHVYWTAKETQMFAQIQFNHITTKDSFMITVQRVKMKFGLNVLWTFVFQTVQSGTVYTFRHTPPVSKTANVKTWLTFIQSNIANLICVSFAVQYIY